MRFKSAAVLAVIAASSLSIFSTSILATERGIVPVVGTTAGAFGSQFRTEVQLANRTPMRMTGWLVYRPAGAHDESEVRTLPYLLEPRATLSFSDVVAELGTEGLGSLDVQPLEGVLPTVVARAFDDQGERGTSGATIRLLSRAEFPRSGERTLLVVPANLESFRFNIGVRTLEDGARVRLRVYGQNGIERHAIERTWGAEYFEQRPAAELLDTTLLSNGSIDVEVLAGSAIFYGTTTDNRSNDPAVQIGPVLRPLVP
jgi:hypothetical protein